MMTGGAHGKFVFGTSLPLASKWTISSSLSEGCLKTCSLITSPEEKCFFLSFV